MEKYGHGYLYNKCEVGERKMTVKILVNATPHCINVRNSQLYPRAPSTQENTR